ncbi:MAG: Adenosyl-chloride synthase [Chroococcopsis gigantea SAG 12.99]|jgi:S-adenosylmethionine hydrolase|nr:SAM-dependent chlorinase/fluorinase [Chlorogloea purpurea SAG 13.99]MDV3002171.1 Adenosyl-chloride synthase [Chroococcopsis gigantea SAG 12.99]
MTERPLITLLTDFGLEDTYVGVMKGVIKRICTDAHLIDLTHTIPPQNVTAAAFALLDAYGHFPRGTIHLAVVDPGVGGDRRGIAVRTAAGYFVGPDNGLFAPIFAISPVIEAVNLDNPQYWFTPEPSKTFHGRDIFAPAAAYLAGGLPLTILGSAILAENIVTLPLHSPRMVAGEIIGEVRSIDRFGNLITNIPAAMVEDRSWCAVVADTVIPSRTSYGEVSPGDYLALVDSNGWIEIAVNSGNAREKSGANIGTAVKIRL